MDNRANDSEIGRFRSFLTRLLAGPHPLHKQLLDLLRMGEAGTFESKRLSILLVPLSASNVLRFLNDIFQDSRAHQEARKERAWMKANGTVCCCVYFSCFWLCGFWSFLAFLRGIPASGLSFCHGILSHPWTYSGHASAEARLLARKTVHVTPSRLAKPFSWSRWPCAANIFCHFPRHLPNW